jgi:hypothetical protein
VQKLLAGRQPADAFAALTDVCTGTRDFIDPAHAKAKPRDRVGENHFFIPTRSSRQPQAEPASIIPGNQDSSTPPSAAQRIPLFFP